MPESQEKSSILERAWSELAKDFAKDLAAENIYQLLTGHKVSELRGKNRQIQSFDLAEKYFNRGRGRLYPEGKQHSQEIFTKLVEEYGSKYSASEMLTILKEAYTFYIAETEHNNENRTFQLLVASLRGKVLYFREKFKHDPEREDKIELEIEPRNKSRVPHRIKKLVGTALAGTALAIVAHTAGFSPYQTETGKADSTADYHADELQRDELDQELLPQVVGDDFQFADHQPKVTETQLSSVFELDSSTRSLNELETSESTPFEMDILREQSHQSQSNWLSRARRYLGKLLTTKKDNVSPNSDLHQKIKREKQLPVPDLAETESPRVPYESRSTVWQPSRDEASSEQPVSSVDWRNRLDLKREQEEVVEVDESPTEINTISLSVSRYEAPTMETAMQVAQGLDFIHDDLYEHPSNMCGPLSADILRQNGILTDNMFPQGFDIQQFWLADPDSLRNLFPEESFDFYNHIGTNEATNTFNFVRFPLQVGDFIYLNGTEFDHMLVVTRVETEGYDYRAYSMTNIKAGSGFVIEERLVFDSQNPETGLFAEFASPDSEVGSTGEWGFLLIRKKHPSNLISSYTAP